MKRAPQPRLGPSFFEKWRSGDEYDREATTWVIAQKRRSQVGFGYRYTWSAGVMRSNSRRTRGTEALVSFIEMFRQAEPRIVSRYAQV